MSRSGKSEAREHFDPDRELERLTRYPFPCPNCDTPIRTARLFCSEMCQQTAKYVRYARACQRDGRAERFNVREALITRRLNIIGGYPEHKRRVPPKTRQAVIERDGGRCRICGAPGEEIDHIQGSSNALENLQLLCRKCHEEKLPTTRLAGLDEALSRAAIEMCHPDIIDARVDAPEPMRLCDSAEWTVLYREIQRRRQKILMSANTDLFDVGESWQGLYEFYDNEEILDDSLSDLSDGEQAEFYALVEGGGDPAWGAAMFGLDFSDNEGDNGDEPS